MLRIANGVHSTMMSNAARQRMAMYATVVPFSQPFCNRHLTTASGNTRTTPVTASPQHHKLPMQIRTILDRFSANDAVGIGDEVVIHGWVQSLRKQKRVAFATLTDGSTAQPLQVVFADPDHCNV